MSSDNETIMSQVEKVATLKSQTFGHISDFHNICAFLTALFNTFRPRRILEVFPTKIRLYFDQIDFRKISKDRARRDLLIPMVRSSFYHAFVDYFLKLINPVLRQI